MRVFLGLLGVVCAAGAIMGSSACTPNEGDGGGAASGSSSSTNGGGGAAPGSGGISGGGTSTTGGDGGGVAGTGTAGNAGAGGVAGSGGDPGTGGVGVGGTGAGGHGGNGAGGAATGGTGGVLDCAPLVDCGGSCVDPLTDPSHCGGCGKVCVGLPQCQAGTCACGDTAISLALQVQPILDASCNTCHSDGNPPQGLDLTPGHTYAFTVNVPSAQCNDGRLRVAPGDPDHSYLLDKILGVDICQGDSMPKNGAPLSPSSVQTISRWICQGALDN